MSKTISSLIFAALMAFSTAAFAQDGEATNYDFEDDLVTGDLVRPDGEQLTGRKKGKRMTLIRVREHFVPEMLKSVENL